MWTAITVHVKWVFCHHDIVQPQDVGGVEGFQTSIAAENILTKLTKNGPPALGLGGDTVSTSRLSVYSIKWKDD